MSKQKLKGLGGLGLNALLGTVETGEHETLQHLPIHELQAGKYQPRTQFDPESLEELANSIREQGLLQPILVRPVGLAGYEIIAGERRWRAAKLAGLKKVPVLVREVADHKAAAMALIENIQRANLNPLEEAHGIARLVQDMGMTHEQVGKKIGRSRSAISNALRLLQLDASVQILLQDKQLEMGHARALLSLSLPQQAAVAIEVCAQGLTVRETEALVQSILNPILVPQSEAELSVAEENSHATPKKPTIARIFAPELQRLTQHFSVPVRLHSKESGEGKLTLSFASELELQALLQQLLGE